MTFSAGSGKSAFDGDGSTIEFPTGFQFILNSHVKVVLRDGNDVEVPWTEGSQYSLTGAGDPGGGTLTVKTAPSDFTPQLGERLFVILDVPFTQEKAFPLGGPLPSTQIEQGLDLLAMGLAKLAEVDRRTLKVPETDGALGTALDLPIDSVRAGKFMAFDAMGNPTPAVGTSGSFNPVSSFVDSLLGSADAGTFRALIAAMVDVITTRGDLVVGNSSGDPARLARGAANLLLGAGASDLAYFGGTVTKSAADSPYSVVVGDHRKVILVDARLALSPLPFLPLPRRAMISR